MNIAEEAEYNKIWTSFLIQQIHIKFIYNGSSLFWFSIFIIVLSNNTFIYV